jgi:hypothetical protein
LARRLLDFGCKAVPNLAVCGLELLQALFGLVDQGETSRLSTTEVGAETKDGDSILVNLVELGELGPKVILGDV